MRFDLHSHSTASDGELAPGDVVRAAAAAGITHLALTDHDTVGGLSAASAAAATCGLTLVPGLEISAVFGRRDVHVLGLWVEADGAAMRAFTASRHAARSDRARRMVEVLSRSGLPITVAEVEDEAAGAPLTRPHVARVLLEKGLVATFDEAFQRWLGDGGPADVPVAQPTLEEAVALVHEAGGVASLAHPGTARIGRGDVRDLAATGLDALEAFHLDHPPSQAEAFVRWGREFGLKATGGSDFHGLGCKPHAKLGLRLTPTEDAIELQARAEARKR